MANDLYIKFSNAGPVDTGARPISPCGPPNIVWMSQSIWLSPPNQPTTTLTEATEGEEIQINVVVTNKGATQFVPDAFGNFVTVQVWICNFATAVGPLGAIASAGGSGGSSGVITGAIAASGGQAATSTRWTPASGDLLINPIGGKGHVCIAANVYFEGTAPGKEGHPAPPADKFQICGEGEVVAGVEQPGPGGHHGQRNILIAAAEPGAKLQALINVFNLSKKAQEYTIEVREARGAMHPATKEALLAHEWVTLAGGKPDVRPRFVHDLPVEPIERARVRAGGRLILARSERPITVARQPVRGLTLGGLGKHGAKVVVKGNPKKPHHAMVEWVQPKAAPGTTHVFDVTQRDTRGKLVGGGRIVAVTQ